MSKRKRVRQLDLKGNIIAIFGSGIDAERGTGIAAVSISACARGKIERTGDCRWEFVPPKPIKKSSKASERQSFFCQCCGATGSRKHKFLVCEGCLNLVTEKRRKRNE